MQQKFANLNNYPTSTNYEEFVELLELGYVMISSIHYNLDNRYEQENHTLTKVDLSYSTDRVYVICGNIVPHIDVSLQLINLVEYCEFLNLRYIVPDIALQA